MKLDFLSVFGLYDVEMVFVAQDRSFNLFAGDPSDDTNTINMLYTPEQYSSEENYKIFLVLALLYRRFQREKADECYDIIYTKAIDEAGLSKEDDAGEFIFPVLYKFFKAYVQEREKEIHTLIQRAKIVSCEFDWVKLENPFFTGLSSKDKSEGMFTVLYTFAKHSKPEKKVIDTQLFNILLAEEHVITHPNVYYYDLNEDEMLSLTLPSEMVSILQRGGGLLTVFDTFEDNNHLYPVWV